MRMRESFHLRPVFYVREDVLNEFVLILCRRKDEYVCLVNCATSRFSILFSFLVWLALAKTILTCHNFLRCQTDQVPISTKVDTATVPKGETFVAKKMINYTTRLSKSVYSANAPVELCLSATLRQVSLQVIQHALPFATILPLD
jgi:hypothetical protein